MSGTQKDAARWPSWSVKNQQEIYYVKYDYKFDKKKLDKNLKYYIELKTIYKLLFAEAI